MLWALRYFQELAELSFLLNLILAWVNHRVIQILILPSVICGPRGVGWLSKCASYFDKIYFYIAFYKMKSSKMCNFMMHDWVIKHIVTAAHLIFSICLSCVVLGYFTVHISNNTQVPHLHTVATTHNHHSTALAKGVAFCWRTEVEQLQGTGFDSQRLTWKMLFVSKEICHLVFTAWREHPVTSNWTLQQLITVCGIFHWRNNCCFLTLQQSWASFSS